VGGRPLLFCGDTLFSGGCGRLFEGTPAQMLASLDRLAALPEATQVCCTHEYTLSNLRFAQAVEPDNAELAAYAAQCTDLRQRNLPTLPSSIGREKLINPFLRSRVPAVTAAMRQRSAQPALDDVGVFGALREWKNVF
jgi:hydroxyacylglutathione hydrolase